MKHKEDLTNDNKVSEFEEDRLVVNVDGNPENDEIKLLVRNTLIILGILAIILLTIQFVGNKLIPDKSVEQNLNESILEQELVYDYYNDEKYMKELDVLAKAMSYSKINLYKYYPSLQSYTASLLWSLIDYGNEDSGRLDVSLKVDQTLVKAMLNDNIGVSVSNQTTVSSFATEQDYLDEQETVKALTSDYIDEMDNGNFQQGYLKNKYRQMFELNMKNTFKEKTDDGVIYCFEGTWDKSTILFKIYPNGVIYQVEKSSDMPAEMVIEGGDMGEE